MRILKIMSKKYRDKLKRLNRIRRVRKNTSKAKPYDPSKQIPI